MLTKQGLEINTLKVLQEEARNFDHISIIQIIDYLEKKGFEIIFEALSDFSSPIYSLNEIVIDEKELKAKMRVNFLSIFGFSPTIQENLSEIMHHSMNNSLLNFLNIFYNRFFEIYFKQFRLKYNFLSMKNHLKMAASISGLFRQQNYNILEYYQYFLTPYRSVKALEKLLIQITDLKVEVIDFKHKYKKIPEEYQMKLEKNNILNGLKCIGKRVLTNNLSIEILFFLEDENKHCFFNNKSKINIIKSIIEKYINGQSEYDIKIKPYLKKTIIISKNKNRLGINTFLCKKNCINENSFFNISKTFM